MKIQAFAYTEVADVTLRDQGMKILECTRLFIHVHTTKELLTYLIIYIYVRNPIYSELTQMNQNYLPESVLVDTQVSGHNFPSGVSHSIYKEAPS